MHGGQQPDSLAALVFVFFQAVLHGRQGQPWDMHHHIHSSPSLAKMRPR
jgi:hypothetical protein